MDIMLRELAVQNLALIEDVRVELQPGFCAWTGETGAGKSLLLGALGLLLGERGSADLIRAGADELRVTGRFELDSDALRTAVAQILFGDGWHVHIFHGGVGDFRGVEKTAQRFQARVWHAGYALAYGSGADTSVRLHAGENRK